MRMRMRTGDASYACTCALTHTRSPAVSDSEQGTVLSAFFYGAQRAGRIDHSAHPPVRRPAPSGYLLTQIPGGIMAARFGGKPVLMVGVALWTLFDVATVGAERLGIVALVAARVCMGAGEVRPSARPPTGRSVSTPPAGCQLSCATRAVIPLVPRC
jgi:ACS family sodium-dependent inorganic phosphate cotransporter-like MFS transporter 5